MKKRFFNLLFKLLIILAVFECVYLFIVPPVLKTFIDKNFICEFIEKNSNIKLETKSLEVKTGIIPSVAVAMDDVEVINKITNSDLITADNVDFKIMLLPLIIKKIEPVHFYADNLQIFLTQNEDGTFDFENLFKSQKSTSMKLNLKNFDVKTMGTVNINDFASDFDINMKLLSPLSLKNFSKNKIEGSMYLYNIDLKRFSHILEKYIPSLKRIDGIVDFLEIKADKTEKENSKINVNTKFKNLLYEEKDWKNYIFANGENIVNLEMDFLDNILKFNSFCYEAENIDISGNGTLKLDKKPILDINIDVKNSKTENIASILPPDLVKETMVIEKVKKYGIYGDLYGSVNIKGTVPKPDVTGYAKGRNVHILDKNTQKLHKGTVDINFDKRKLNMDILLEMPNGQNAKIKGTTFMYRDGVNDVTVKTTNNLDFPLAQKLVVPISDVFSFQLGPLPDMHISRGKGNIDVHIKGSLDFIDLDGYCDFRNADLTYNNLYGNITNADGRLDFKGDNILVKTKKAFIQKNPFYLDGIVKINNNLNFNLLSNNAKAEDLFEIIQKSEILKDVKKGLSLFKSINGKTNLNLNITADIVPVPFGMPPLPPDKAFKNMKIKGVLNLLGDTSYLEGFETPLTNIIGNVNFTEKLVDFKDLNVQSGNSLLTLDGNIFTDIKTKIPDVDVIIKGNSINIGDSLKFLSKSYIYPKNYPDISFLYDLKSKHDLYLKYKAKSALFVPEKVYAVMNIVKDDEKSNIKAKSGRVVLENGLVKIEDVKIDVLNSNVNISGTVKDTNKVNPIYKIKISADRFNLEKLNNLDEIASIPNQLKELLNQFSDYKGFMDFSTEYKNDILKTNADFKNLSFIQNSNKAPIKFDDFNLEINNDELTAKNITFTIADMPVYSDLKIKNIYKVPYFDGYFTAKLTDKFIKSCFNEPISNKITLSGDINVSSSFKGKNDEFELNPEITLYPEADAKISGVKIGDSSDKQVFKSNIKITKDKINIEKFDYYRYITTQNNTVYPAHFAYGNGILKYNEETNNYEPEIVYVKTEKNLSAKLLNAFLDKPIFKQGSINCDIKYYNNKLDGNIDAKNIDIPIVDTVVKNIKLNTDEDKISIKLFGFISDSAVRVESSLDNDIQKTPHIDTLKVFADKIDTDKFLKSISNAGEEFNIKKKNSIKTEIPAIFRIENGELHVNSLAVKNCTAENVDSKFSIDNDGNLKIKDLNVKLGGGSATGEIIYDIDDSEILAQIAFNNVDANYIAENLFDAKNQIYGIANANFLVKTSGNSDEELIKNLSGFAYFDMQDGKMPKLGSLEYLLRASNIVKGGVTRFTINNVLEILNLVKTGHFSNINGSCKIENGMAKNVEIFSQGENLSLYLHGEYDIPSAYANMEVLGKLSNRISTIFGPIGNTSLNTFFKYIPGISLLDFSRKDIINNVEKIPPFTKGDYESRIFRAIINGDINSSGYVQSFKWVKM